MWFLPDPIVLAPATRPSSAGRWQLYAGMVENLDFHVGRLIAHPEGDRRVREHDIHRSSATTGRGADLFAMIAGAPGRATSCSRHRSVQDRSEVVGEAGSYPSYGPAWAQVSMTPFSQYKAMTARAASAMP